MRDPIVIVAVQLILVGVAATGSAAARATSFYECSVDPSPIPEDDAHSLALQTSIPFYGQTHNSLYVSDNGILQFGSPPSKNKSETVIGSFAHRKDSIFIAPLYGDFIYSASEISSGELVDGEIAYCEEAENTTVFQRVRNDIREFTGNHSFQPKTLIIATWNRVEYFDTKKCSGRNEFQCVLATDDEEMTFALFLYQELSWCSNYPVSIGFSNGTSGVWEMSCSGTEGFQTLVNTSNVGTPGLWLFRVDQDIQPVCLNKTLCSDDSVCSCLQSCSHTNCQCKDSCTDDDDDVYCSERTSPLTPSPPPPSEPTSEEIFTDSTEINAEAIYIPIIVIVLLITIIILTTYWLIWYITGSWGRKLKNISFGYIY